MALRKHPTISCCGIDCGLCPRYYTVGKSRCPGCGGEGFELQRPTCPVINCCVKKRGLEVCAECLEFPCARYDKESTKKDSFCTHRRMMPNQRLIKEIGLDAFLEQQSERITFLETALERHDNGRNKSYFCLAAALLSIDSLKKALSLAEQGENLRDVLKGFANEEGQELALKK
jgi:hypothetical protein